MNRPSYSKTPNSSPQPLELPFLDQRQHILHGPLVLLRCSGLPSKPPSGKEAMSGDI